MSVSTIGSSPSTIGDLIAQRRQSRQDLVASVPSGGLVDAQQSLAATQGDTPSTAVASASGGQAVNPYRSSLATDLTSLASSTQSGDQSQASAAPTTFQTDTTGTIQSASGAHHGHHHHGGGGGSSSTSQQIADALFSPDQTSTGSALGTDASSTTSDVLSQLLASLDAKQS